MVGMRLIHTPEMPGGCNYGSQDIFQKCMHTRKQEHERGACLQNSSHTGNRAHGKGELAPSAAAWLDILTDLKRLKYESCWFIASRAGNSLINNHCLSREHYEVLSKMGTCCASGKAPKLLHLFCNAKLMLEPSRNTAGVGAPTSHCYAFLLKAKDVPDCIAVAAHSGEMALGIWEKLCTVLLPSSNFSACP